MIVLRNWLCSYSLSGEGGGGAILRVLEQKYENGQDILKR